MSIRYQQVIPVDSLSELLVAEDPEIYYIHSGKGFSSSISLSIANSATGYILLVTGNDNQHLHLRDYAIEATSAPVTITLYEGATVSNSGTPVSVINLNRTSANTTTASLYSAPTVTGNGTQLIQHQLTGTKQDGGFGMTTSKEIVLNSNTNYLFAIANTSGGSSTVMVRPFWVEV